MRRRVVTWLLLVAVCAACSDDDAKPESVPFNPLDPSVAPKSPQLDPTPASTPAETTDTAPKPGPRPVSNTGRLSSCCAALATLGKTASDPGRRSNAGQAALVCQHQVIEVQRGKISVDSALSRVRSSLLGPAPAACN